MNEISTLLKQTPETFLPLYEVTEKSTTKEQGSNPPAQTPHLPTP